MTLAGLELSPVVTWSDTQIVVPMPAFPPGSYLLTVARESAEFHVSQASLRLDAVRVIIAV